MIYLDHTGGTPCPPRVMEAMLPYFSQRSGDPAAIHAPGRAARQGMDLARRQVAALVDVHESQVIFTGSAMESNHLALVGLASRGGFKGHMLLSEVEHPSLLMTALLLEQRGMTVSRLPVDAHGRVDPAQLHAHWREDTVLVSVQTANGETGVIQPLAEIAPLCRARGVLLHSDASAATGRMPLSLHRPPVDLLTLSGEAMGAPVGIAALVVGKGVALDPVLVGGGQERGRRAGRENLPGMVGFGAACAMAREDEPKVNAHLRLMREHLETGLHRALPQGKILGEATERLPHITAFALPHLDAETLVMQLDLAGYALSSGSRCSSGRNEPSHVTRAMGLGGEFLGGVIRVGLGRDNTTTEVDRFVSTLLELVKKMQSGNPLLKG